MRIHYLPERTYFLLLAILSMALRSLWIFCIPNFPVTDCSIYFNLAKELAEYGTYSLQGKPSAYWPIGYPLFLALFFKLFGVHYIIPKIVNVFLGVAICLFTYKIASRLYGKRVARIAGIIIACFPSQIFFTGLSSTEILFTSMFIVVLWLVIAKVDIQKISFSTFLIGFLLGAASLVRPGVLLFPAVVFVYFILMGSSLIRELRRSLIIVVTMMIVISPWLVRNYRAMGEFVLISTSGGINFYIGNGPYANGHYVDITLIDDCEMNDEMSEIAYNRLGFKLGFESIVERPFHFIVNCFKKVFYFFTSDIMGFYLNVGALDHPPPRWVTFVGYGITQGYYMVIAGLAFFQVYRSVRNGFHRSRVALLIILICYWVGIHLIFFGMGRYHFPVIPLFAILGAKMLASLMDVRRNPREMFHRLTAKS